MKETKQKLEKGKKHTIHARIDWGRASCFFSVLSQREISAKLGGEAGVKEKISHVKGVKGETIVIKI